MNEMVFTNARIVTRDEMFDGSILVRDRAIADVDRGRIRLPGATDCDGDIMVPGLVELHTDNMERHFAPRPGVDWPGPVAATAHDAQIAAAGITTVYDAIVIGDIFDERSERVRHLSALIDAVRWGHAERCFRVEHRLHLRCEIASPTVVSLFQPYAEDPLVGLVSLMDHTPGQRQFVNFGKYREFYQARYRVNDVEMDAMIARQVDMQQRHAATNRGRIVEIARARGLPLASHDDALPEHVAEAVADGLILAEFPTTVEAAEAARAGGMHVLMGAPNLVLGGSHSGNVAAADLAGLGLLDILSSDYVPHSLLHGAFILADQGMALPDAIRTITLSPAMTVGLDDRGEIVTGKRADLVRVRPGAAGPIVREVWRGGERIA